MSRESPEGSDNSPRARPRSALTVCSWVDRVHPCAFLKPLNPESSNAYSDAAESIALRHPPVVDSQILFSDVFDRPHRVSARCFCQIIAKWHSSAAASNCGCFRHRTKRKISDERQQVRQPDLQSFPADDTSNRGQRWLNVFRQRKSADLAAWVVCGDDVEWLRQGPGCHRAFFDSCAQRSALWVSSSRPRQSESSSERSARGKAESARFAVEGR